MHSWIRRLRLRLRALVLSRHDRELRDELQAHLEMLEDEYREKGMDSKEARVAARRQFGNATALKEQSRDLFTFQFLDDLWRDIRFGIHSLWRVPSFALGAVATLALGIGGTVGAFSLVNGVAFAPLPFDRPEELVTIDPSWGDSSQGNESFIGASMDLLEDLSRAKSFTGVSGWRNVLVNRHDDGPPDTLSMEQITGAYFETLGIKPVVGSVFTSSEMPDNGTLPAVISYDYWQKGWSGSRDVIGRTFKVKGLSGPGAGSLFTIVGVLPPAANGPRPFGSEETSVWTPALFGNRFQVFARLKPGETVTSAGAEMDVLSAQLKDRFAEEYANVNSRNPVRLRVTSAADAVVGNSWPLLIAFSTAVGCVFLIAVLNLTNLQAARILKRGRELSIRASLGASRRRLARQMIVESMLLTLTGAILGFFVAHSIRDIALAAIPSQNVRLLPRLETITIDFQAFTFAVIVGLGAGIAIGLVPAFRASRGSLDASLKDGSSNVIDHRSQHRLQQVLIGVETMVAVVLLVVAGLFLEDFRYLVTFDPGFSANNVVAAEINLPRQYGSAASREIFFRDVAKKIRSLPAVDAVSVSSQFPQIASTARLASPGTQGGDAVIVDATPDYLKVFRLRMLSGRWITDDDVRSKAFVAVVSARVAQELFPGLNPIGRRVTMSRAGGRTFTVVGVAGDVQFSANQARFLGRSGHLYTPYAGEKASLSLDERMTVAVRLPQGRDIELAELLERAEPNAVIKAVFADQAIAPWITVERFFASVLSFCSIAAFVLAMMGIYSLVMYSTGERSREVGLRVALGATSQEIVFQMMRRGAVPAAVGLAVGSVVSFGASRLLESFLTGVKPGESAAFAAVLSSVVLLVLLAAWIPAWRASRVDPMTALRHE